MTRPQLNETGLDPDVYLNEFSYAEMSRGGGGDGSVLLKAWELKYLGDH